MQIEVPDDIVRSAEANRTDLRIALAVQLYADNRIAYDEACRLAGVAASMMNQELLQRGITLQQYVSPGMRRREAG